MNQTYREMVKAAEEKRRDYLRTKTRTVAIAAVSGVTAIALILLTLSVSLRDPVHFGEVAVILVGLSGAVIMAIVAALGCGVAVKQALSLPHVPAVRSDALAIPAEDILVRGSGAPPAEPRELLRAARVGVETAVEELVRPR